ncbi:hypothetical protein FB595_104202 [Sphingobium sp. AEW010]|jgi:hypothetical protein|nr:hypothetical protein [Sphingobium sp. JAI105]TWD09855.1 hypothetical protein FB595_104202 [Sphingobium sp. AEW010]TWD26526.1 hypothetical protein FB596_104202 [Sphingobium sp. AEW013]TWD27705.1 hypothetical protein FB594_105126 [Sphingobium sp. AEW001]
MSDLRVLSERLIDADQALDAFVRHRAVAPTA